jgi:hypothetical protein
MPDLFDGGPPLGLQRRLGLVDSRDRKAALRASLAAGIAWIPLLVLNAARQLSGHDSLSYFLLDLGASTRFLVAGPLLILGECSCLPKLSKIPEYFLHTGLIGTEEDRMKALAAMAAARRMLNSVWVEVFAVLLAYGLVGALYTTAAVRNLPAWHIVVDDLSHATRFSAAGRWHEFVSLPLLIVLFFGWMWRQLVWWKLLSLLSKLNLKLIAAHPDRAGGLSFLATVIRGYWLLAMALSAILAGRIGNQLRAGASLYEFRFHVVGLVAVVLAIVLAPFMAFVPTLVRLKDAGTFEYGSVARGVGERFEFRWLKEQRADEALESPQFSATTDLYSIVANVSQLSWFPVGFAPIRTLALVTLLPFVPVLLIVVPFSDLFRELRKLLL